jgi:uncharacterized protein YndB with AHSA1/START domain
MNASLRVVRVIPADIERVFRAWSDASMLARWFGCGRTTSARATIDFRVGGRYRIILLGSDGPIGQASGEYVEIQPPHRMVFTWSSQGRVRVPSSLVTLELHGMGASTELILTQDLSPHSRGGAAHKRGWHDCLDNLQRFLAYERKAVHDHNHDPRDGARVS